MRRDSVQEDFIKAIAPYWNDRALFVRNILSVERIDPLQLEVLKALDTNDHVSVRAGHGTGKTALLAWIILHYICTRPHCKIPCTSPTKHQLFDVLWSELSMWHGKMGSTDIGGLFARNLEWKKESFVNLLSPADWFAAPRTASKDRPEALQGFHARYVLKVVDEASGVPDEVIEVLEGAYGTEETKGIWTANPTKISGAFYRSHRDPRELKFFKQVQMNCEKSTLTPTRYIERMASKYGVNSNIYKVRVEGEFPENDSESFIPLGLAEGAYMRDIVSMPTDKLIWGVDVARNITGGDRSVIARRRGNEFLPYEVLRLGDTMKLVNHIARRAKMEKPDAIFVDVIGFGAGVYDRLHELGFPAFPVNVAETVSMEFPDRYRRLRDELWGKMREWLEQGRGKLWDNEDHDLVNELSLPRFSLPNGKIVIESKEEIQAREPGIGSPDIADAHLLTFAAPMSSYSPLTEQYATDYNRADDFVLDDKAGY